MTFCPTLNQAAMACTMSSHEDFNFLSEFRSTFKGLSSVTQLALQVLFIHKESDKMTWWGSSEEQSKRWSGGNKKTETIWNLLQVSRELSSLELYGLGQGRNPGDHPDLHSSSLSALHQSHSKLKQLRLLGINANIRDPSTTTFSHFKGLKFWSLELFTFINLLQYSQIQLPPNSGMICIPFCTKQLAISQFQEERLLAALLNSRSIPKLQRIAVPKRAVHMAGRFFDYVEDKKLWQEAREHLGSRKSSRVGESP